MSSNPDRGPLMFPKHEINPITYRCNRCQRDQTELASGFYSCMTDEEINWTKRQVEKRVSALVQPRTI